MTLTDKTDKTMVEYGDYQTPPSFAMSVCSKISAFYGLHPDVIIEPTFGLGNFFHAICTAFPLARTLYGIEINSDYYSTTLGMIEKSKSVLQNVELYNADVFSFDFSEINDNLSSSDSLLIIGNPPWVTNSQLTSIGSSNLPLKSNYKGFSGLEAITGKANFDIAEYIVLLLLREFANKKCTLAMLCKNIVARNIIHDVNKYNFTISSMDLFTFNANEVFNVSCDASLLVIQLGESERRTCTVYDFYSNNKIREFGWIDDKFYSNTQDLDIRLHLDGKCQLEWRQGIKHDCSKIMELEANESLQFHNGMGETVELRLGSFVYPLVKSSDVKSHEITNTRKYVIVPKKRVNEDTSHIREVDRAVWEYLHKHEEYLLARKSSIYKNAPSYSIFGIGEYSFSKYKVGISGFYKEPVFSLLVGEIPIMMDDTCYFLSFDNIKDAVITLAILNSTECTAFLKSIAFLDSKRPYTKEILQRIDLDTLCKTIDFNYINCFINTLSGNYHVSETDYESYRALFSPAQLLMEMH